MKLNDGNVKGSIKQTKKSILQFANYVYLSIFSIYHISMFALRI